MNMRKMLTGALACAMALSMSVPAFAADVETAGGNSGDIPVTVTAEAPTFRVTMPASFNIHVDANGTVTMAETYAITNQSNGAVDVKGMTASAAGSYTLVDFTDHQFSGDKVNARNLGLSINGYETNADGGIDFDDNSMMQNALDENYMWTGVAANDQEVKNNVIDLDVDARVSAFNAAVDSETAANVVFTVGWYTAD